MPRSPGTRLGVYEVSATIGEGGMELVEGPTLADRIARGHVAHRGHQGHQEHGGGSGRGGDP